MSAQERATIEQQLAWGIWQAWNRGHLDVLTTHQWVKMIDAMWR